MGLVAGTIVILEEIHMAGSVADRHVVEGLESLVVGMGFGIGWSCCCTAASESK